MKPGQAVATASVAAVATRAFPADPREIDSGDLLRGDRVLVIRHGMDAYRLQRTAAGKLILTK